MVCIVEEITYKIKFDLPNPQRKYKTALKRQKQIKCKVP